MIEVLHLEFYSTFLPMQILRIKVEDVPTSELRGWLFQVCSVCQDHESYEEINIRARKCLRYERYALCDEAIQLIDRALWKCDDRIRVPRSMR